MNFDLSVLWQWGVILIGLASSTGMTLWAIWMSGKTFREKLDKSVPIVWAAVQQELRKNGGKLPGGKSPLDLALLLMQSFVKFTPEQRQMVELALKGFHERQGAPNPMTGVPRIAPAPATTVVPTSASVTTNIP